jgi:hypothetical protein
MFIHIEDWYWNALSRIISCDGAHVRALFWAGYWWRRSGTNLYERLNGDLVVATPHE